MKLQTIASVLALGVALTASQARAAELARDGAPASPISNSVYIPAGSAILFVAGQVAPRLNPDAPAGVAPDYGDTKTQSMAVFQRLQASLKAKGMDMGDIAMMRVYLVADPAKGNVMDSAGMNEAYRTFFGTAAQPNKPARITVQVARLGGPGVMVEIEAQAAKAP
jgi:enamine deaminase RidA (YjgF/YER057c/UK114 family)